MQTHREMAEEAVACRESGDHHGFGQCLQEMEAQRISSAKIQKLLADAEAARSNGSTPAVASSKVRDARLPIPQEEWPRPRLGFAPASIGLST